MKKATSPIAISANGMPNPMPIFAPLDNPFELGFEVEELVGMDVGFVGTPDDCVVADGLSVAAANAAKSELWYHTGMPSP